MTRLLLIRHGESTWNAEGRVQGWANPPLSEIGCEQARQLARRLAGEERSLAAIYTSSLMRARQTAEAISAVFGLAAQADERLREMHVGDLTGLTGPEIEQRFPEWIALRRAGQWVTPPGGEDGDSFADRSMAAMADLLARHPEQTVAVVSHGGTLGVCLAGLLDLPPRRSPPFQFDNASLSILRAGEQRIRLIKLNDTAHLKHGLE